jgi:integrase
MARSATLEPSKVSGRLRPWCVNVPAELSSTGKRRQLFFATKKDALTECETLKARRDNFGVSLTAMTPARIAKAAEAYKLLDPHNIDLLEAARGYLANHKQRSASIPFGQLFKLFLEAKEKRSRAYRNHLQWLQKRTESIHNRLASDITVRDLDALLEGEKPTVRNAWMRYLRAVFNWGLKRDYLASNPIGKMDFEDVIKGDTQIFEAKDVQAILKDCLENDLPLLPYRVFGFFCGVRPDGELPRLVWSDLEWHDKVLRLRAEITKKKRLRFVEVGENVIDWLQEYQRRGGKTDGPVVPFTKYDLRAHHRENWARVVGVTKDGKPKRRWIQQGMRHSFCSYWLAKFADIDRLVIQSGHESKEVMWRNYYRATTRGAAEKFWAIRPPMPMNIVPMAQAS